MSDLDVLRQLAQRKDIRSADRANLRAMLHRIDRREVLTYQERQNLWAYIGRYCRPLGQRERDTIWAAIERAGRAAWPVPR